jgi:hypothetical protein
METPGTSAVIVDSWSATGPVSIQSEAMHALARDQWSEGLPYWENNSFIPGC